MIGRLPALEPGALECLERLVVLALESAEAPAPEVIGYGEISSVLALRAEGGGVACKRLPPFRSEGEYAAYDACLQAQIAAFEAHGIPLLATELRRLAGTGCGIVAYCIQPLVDGATLLPVLVARRTGEGGLRLVEDVLDMALAYVGPTRGFDAQLSNWALLDGALVYLDVTTPFLRDDDGRERLDVDLLLASLPWALRGFVKRFLVRTILDPYYSRRGVTLDLLGNLIKEGLADRLPALVPRASQRLGEPLSLEDVRRHYATDARMWSLLQRLRLLDRAWQRHVRRRPYPFLLPGPVERHV
jgi:hypothetical protein